MSKWDKYAGVFVSLCLFISTVYFIFVYKKMSSLGRIAIWKICSEHIIENFWFGAGIGKFPFYYPQWQARYFNAFSDLTHSDYLCSDEVHVAFNEYIELLLSGGIFLFLFIAIVIIKLFRYLIKKNNSISNTTRMTVSGIMICSVTSYPLHVNIFMLIIAILLGISFTSKYRSLNNNKYIRIYYYLISIIAIISCTISFKKWRTLEKWKIIQSNYTLSDKYRKRTGIYCYSKLNKDGKFLTEYGYFLINDMSDINTGISVLEQAKKLYLSRYSVEALANAYIESNNLPKAIENYEWICTYTPNKFVPKYKLMNLYLNNRDTNSAIITANLILKMPVKIPKNEIEIIKIKTNKLLLDLTTYNKKIN